MFLAAISIVPPAINDMASSAVSCMLSAETLNSVPSVGSADKDTSTNLPFESTFNTI